jgi:hypothetical protein
MQVVVILEGRKESFSIYHLSFGHLQKREW